VECQVFAWQDWDKNKKPQGGRRPTMMRKKCAKNKIIEYEVAHDSHDERNVHKEAEETRQYPRIRTFHTAKWNTHDAKTIKLFSNH
jgi:hypothetical protein